LRLDGAAGILSGHGRSWNDFGRGCVAGAKCEIFKCETFRLKVLSSPNAGAAKAANDN
jgi:hypothetical protein